MKAVVFSDIHGNQYALQNFLNELQEIEYQYLIFCGDIYGYYYGQHEIIRCFQQLDRLYAVKGNHDEMAVHVSDGKCEVTAAMLEKYGHSYCMIDKDDVDYVRKLPNHLELEIDGKRIVILHGTVEDELAGRLYPADEVKEPEAYRNYDYVICGHTHYKMYRKTGDTVILNPGSIGQQRDGRGFGYAIIDFENGKYEFRNIRLDLRELEKEIDLFDKENEKLKQILHRGGY